MPVIYQKRTSDLTADEIRQIEHLLGRYYHADERYLKARTSPDCNFDVVLMKEGEDIVGVNYYQVNKMVTPFSRKSLTVIQFGLALKKRGYRGNIIWTLGNWYARKNIGWLYPFKRAVGISAIVSPKVFEHFTKLFPHHYPRRQWFGMFRRACRTRNEVGSEIRLRGTSETLAPTMGARKRSRQQVRKNGRKHKSQMR